MGSATQLVSLIPIRWIVIYPLDSDIQRLNNWVLDYSSMEGAGGGAVTRRKSIQHNMTRQLLLGT